jgi:DNA-binding response OmpR family regulator
VRQLNSPAPSGGRLPAPQPSRGGPANRRLLLVEDDPAVQRILTLCLREDGFELVVTSSGVEGMDLLSGDSIDVVLLDLMLPDLDGLEFCRRVRHGSDIPLIIVTARADSHDMVAGLEAGADDYIVKPFVAKVLAARIRALLRRYRSGVDGHAGSISFGDLEIRPAEAIVSCGGSPVSLTRTEFRLLVELAERSGEVVGRDELLQRVWGYDFPGDGRLVDVHIRRLRAKVEPVPAKPRHLLTVRGLGYKLQP